MGTQAGPTPVAPLIGHVGLNVTSLTRSLNFYRAVCGFDLLAEGTDDGRRYAFLGHGDTITLTLWQQSDGVFQTAQPGLHHIAFSVPTLEDVEAVQDRLRRLDVPLIYDDIIAHQPGATSGGIFFTDPDGIRVEICTSDRLEAHPAREDGAPSCGFF
ncbi:glyoxalase [Mycobacterium sp. ACS1612]|uniref:VOC family protein n=1 Tax=Mycobacterium sp. ACS1612 TaxID=1834117 RepID=UPI0007FD271D|nr:VOC family protein [Mycobacterium sp. ACS1612]OBF33660.1 glyoxalase [Mycobacterium sp. ACS1612]